MRPRTTRILGGALVAAGVVVIGVGLAGRIGSWGAETTTATRTSTTTSSAPATDRRDGSTSTTAPTEEDAAAFLDALGAALRTGDTDFLVSRLDPAVVSRYGSAQCLGALAGARDPSATFSVVRVGDPTDFDWTTDGRTISIAGTVAVDVDRVQRGVSSAATLHLVEIGGRFTWLVDCGSPIGP